jgi:hypothetical protein
VPVGRASADKPKKCFNNGGIIKIKGIIKLSMIKMGKLWGINPRESAIFVLNFI